MRSDQEIAKTAKERIDQLLPGAPWTTLGEKAVMNAIYEAIVEVRMGTLLGITKSEVLPGAITQAKAALVGDSNDAEHDALHSLIGALGYEVPDCDCPDRSDGEPHALGCPCEAWEANK